MQELPILDRARIASPCSASWEQMAGDDRKRFCGQCQKHVYNLSAMAVPEAEALLAGGERVCARLYRRRDGTVLTADCPVGRGQVRRFLMMRAGLAVGTLLTIPAVAGALQAAKIREWSLWDRPPFYEFALKVGFRHADLEMGDIAVPITSTPASGNGGVVPPR